VGACRAFAVHGFDYGFAGHLTVRDPEFPELYWTNPMAVHFSAVKMSNLILANHAGEVVEGHYALNRAGFVLHSAVHEAHPDIIAMCHAHTVYGTAWCTTGRPLDMISQDRVLRIQAEQRDKANRDALAWEARLQYGEQCSRDGEKRGLIQAVAGICEVLYIEMTPEAL